MDFDKQTQWADTLLACSAVRERKTRDVIVDHLPKDIRSRISRNDSDHVDVMSVLTRVLEFEDGITQLIKIVQYYEKSTESMQAVVQLYEQTYPTLPALGFPEPELTPHDPPSIPLPPILDRKKPVAIFAQLLDQNHPCRFMRLSGAAKMGKSHLLTKVFPALAQQQRARCVVMEMRRGQTVIDWLYYICMRLGIAHFPAFDKAYQEWLYRPLRPEQDIQALASALNAQGQHDTPQMIPYFTRLLVAELRQLNDRPIVLFCDAMDDSQEDIQEWLMNSLLIQLQPLNHLHIVVAGRDLPPESGTYAGVCQSYELGSVEDHEAYIDYCQALEIELDANVIREFAKIFGYAPGRFVETVREHYLSKDHPYA